MVRFFQYSLCVVLFISLFLGKDSLAAVLFEQSKIGAPYDLFEDSGSGTGFYSKLPQYSGTGVFYPGGGISYSGTLAWLRVKRISGVACEVPNNVNITTTEGAPIGYGGTGSAVGDYCDFPIDGPNLTNQAVGYVGICTNGGCKDEPGPLVLDGSPENAGFVQDGSQTNLKAGGWAFQLCDAEGCSGGFETVEPPEPPETQGASNVLFLPGIQSSRLYKDNFFGDGRDQVWPPNTVFFGDDIYDLSMSASGVSENDIYTEDVIDTTAGAGAVYGSFIDFLNDLQSEGVINDWTPFAYDWRYSVTDVAQNGTQYRNEVKNALTVINNLATSSLSGKVTIIGHSNGGLLAKAVMRRLENEGKTNLVDKVVLLASPQLGTPKSIGTILHGYDQTDAYGGFVTNAYAARKVINNLPGAYGLLPTEKYFEGLNDPLVTFSDVTATAPYRQNYGSSISSYDDYVRFLKGEDGIDRDINNVVSNPARVNPVMLDDALAMYSEELDDWIAPEGIEVIEIAGTGLTTMKAVEYREITEDKCASAGLVGQVCVTEHYIKPYAVLSKYGDSTVLQRSAEAYEGEKRKYFLNLKRLEDSSLNGEYVHYNIVEAPPLQDLIGEIIIGTTTSNNQFISKTHTEFDDSYDIESIDSPVRLLATDSKGNQTGTVLVDGNHIIKQEIPGSQYFEFGDTKYFVVPKGTDRVTRLYGEDYGGYTLTTAELDRNDSQVVKTTLVNASTTPTMVAEYSNTNKKYSTVMTDIDGDGDNDFETTLDGEIVEEEVIITYSVLISSVEKLNTSKSRKQTLILLIKSAEHYGAKVPSKKLYRDLEDVFLTSAQELVKLYLKKRYITQEEAEILRGMILFLKNKQ
jgi:pimeloyl-ACP methyl ester carboxylesterase